MRAISPAAIILALGLAACGGSNAHPPSAPSTAAVPVLHLTGADQGVICAGINAMVVTSTTDPFENEASVTAGKFAVSTAEAARAVASAIRDRCPKLISVIPATGAASASSAAQPGVSRYPDAASLVTALTSHGDICSGPSYTGSEMATCQPGPTTVLTFSSAKATHANLVKVGQDMLALATATGKTLAAVIGPNWIVTGTPGFCMKVQHDLGGQYIGPGAG